MQKLTIFPKEAMVILDISLRKAQNLMNDIRFCLNKQKHHYVTIKEFAEYTGVSEELILFSLERTKRH
ncbi:hypothetical protein [Pedobacter sp. JY14-1]|uniref:hypothetical protein n=1 Tax=Pedobacter sp. JY14-1 TaxID=3034151 RepID=UPI0023E226B9|nr:hypothetical protein [Pedobacter sp. JY14-1]